MIEGVVLKGLVTHVDQRGFFREVIRVSDAFFGEGFGQLSHSFLHHGVAKAWHLHRVQVDWWYVVSGVLKVALHDRRPDSPTFRVTQEFVLGEHHPAQAVRIPPGVAHGCRCLSGEAHLLYVTSNTYDPSDELRIPHDDPSIGYDWTADPAIT